MADRYAEVDATGLTSEDFYGSNGALKPQGAIKLRNKYRGMFTERLAKLRETPDFYGSFLSLHEQDTGVNLAGSILTMEERSKATGMNYAELVSDYTILGDYLDLYEKSKTESAYYDANRVKKGRDSTILSSDTLNASQKTILGAPSTSGTLVGK